MSVRTVEALRADAAAVPDVAFALHSRWDVTDFGPHYTGRTDASGHATVRIARGNLPSLEGEVVKPGYQRRSRSIRELRGAWMLMLVAQPGGTAYGTVVDGSGAPIRAELDYDSLEHGRRAALQGAVTIENLHEGRFALHLARETGLVLTADAKERGSGALRLPRLAVDALPQDLTLAVEGPGVLRGIVRGPAGEPTQGLPLLVQLAELDVLRSRYLPAAADSWLRARGGGHGRLWLVTDAEGRFEARGLRAGSYFVRAQVGGWSAGESVLLTPQPVPPDGARLDLVQARPVLVVRLLEQDGTAFTGEIAGWHARDEASRQSSVERVVLFVLDGGPLDEAPRARGTPLPKEDPPHRSKARGEEKPGERSSYELLEDRQYLVTAIGAGFDAAPRLVEVPAGTQRIELALVRGQTPEPATLAVTAATTVAANGHGSAAIELALEDPVTGVRLFSRSARAPASFEVQTPPGRHRVVVEGRPTTEWYHRSLMAERVLGRSARTIELLAGERRELHFDLSAGARLELELRGQPRVDGRAASPLAWLEEQDDPIDAQVELLADDARVEPVVRLDGLAGESFHGPFLTEEWPLGQTHRSEVLPAGEHTLVGRLPDGRVVRVPVVLEAGGTTRAVLDFGR